MESIAMLYDSFVCFLTGFFALAAFRYSSRKRKFKEIEYPNSLDYFFLALSVTWILSGMGVLGNWLGHPEFGRAMFWWFLGGFVYVHLLPAINYFGWSFFENKKKIRMVFNGFFVLTCSAAILALMMYGFTQPEMEYWGADVVPNSTANNIFILGIFLPGFICIITELIKRFRRWRKAKSPAEKRLFGFALAFFIYAVGGVFDGLGSVREWMILLARSIIMISLLVFYLFATMEE